MAAQGFVPPALIPREPPCPKCGPHEAHILPCDLIGCDCVAVHPYGGQEEEWLG